MWEKEREWEGEGGMWEGGRRKTQTQRKKERERERETACLSSCIFAVTASIIPLDGFSILETHLMWAVFATAVNLPLYLAVKPNVPSEEVHYRIRQPDF